MSDPIPFDHATTRLRLPLLYSGQAQKEVFVNEALSIIDVLLHGAVEGTASSPPSSPENGEAWLVGRPASGIWAGFEDTLAFRRSGAWVHVAPREGMRLRDRSNGQDIVYAGGWEKASLVAEPIGGSTVDSEARAAINDLLVALRVLGVLPDA